MRTRLLAIAMLCSFAVSFAGAATTLELHGVQFPERRDVDVEFTGRPGAPKASMEARVTFKEGQARIALSYEEMKPAILYGGDVTCYVLWAVTRGGNVENLGEVLADESDGDLEFATAKKEFALMLTAEPYYLVSTPSELVVFTSSPIVSKRVNSSPFNFSDFAAAPAHAMTDISRIAWDSEIPLELLQARTAFDLAERADAQTHAPRILGEARSALAEANELAARSPRSRKLLDSSRRAVALSNEAVNIAVHRREGIELERRIAERKAEMAALEQRAAQAEAEASQAAAQVESARSEIAQRTTSLQQIEAQAAVLRGEKDSLETEKATLEASMSSLRDERAQLEQATLRLSQEKSELGSRLEEALSHVAETRNSARGFVVSLPDILFDVGQATLKQDAKLTLAKLSGIILLMPDLGAIIEGHTDSTGSADFNLELSQRRASAVMGFLAGQGVPPEKLKAVGFGMQQPVADNATAEGRARNRRVEIVISEATED